MPMIGTRGIPRQRQLRGSEGCCLYRSTTTAQRTTIKASRMPPVGPNRREQRVAACLNVEDPDDDHQYADVDLDLEQAGIDPALSWARCQAGMATYLVS